MQLPLVSVIIPCYNVSAFVEKAIRSIICQTYTNLEIFIIDDASTDDTLIKIKYFTDKRIKTIEYKENTKKIGAVNEALKKVNGDFICFQDADDWSDPTRIEKQVKRFFENRELGICFTGYKNIGIHNHTPSSIALSNEDLRDEFIDFGHKKNKYFHATCCASMMISKDILIDICNSRNYDQLSQSKASSQIMSIQKMLQTANATSTGETKEHRNYLLQLIKNHLNASQTSK
jgi:glycosyltransferase involved in cell wall biosynthesis